MAYTSLPSASHFFNKKTKHFSTPKSIVLEATYGDNDVTMTFSDQAASMLNDRITEGLEVIQVGSKRLVSDDFSVSEIIEGPLAVAYTSVPDHIEGGADLYIGEIAATEWDIAWSPSNGAVAIRQASSYGLNDYFEQATAELLESMNSEEEGGEESAETEEGTEEAPANPHAATYKSLAEIALLSGDHAKALEYASEAANEEDCAAFLMTGNIQLLSGDLAAAQESYAASVALYSPWDALDLETRKELTEEAQDDQPKPQDASCFQAVGLHAVAAAAAGNMEALAGLDIGMEGMSYLPALGVGNAHLAAGESTEALAAYLQVARIERLASWSGMGIAQLAKGQVENAINNLEQAMWHEGGNLELARHYVAALTASSDADSAATTMGEMAAKLPTNGTWHLAHAEALAAAGHDNSEALAQAEAQIQQDLIFRNNAESMGLFAHAKIARGDLTTGKAIANRAVNTGIFAPSALTALATIAVQEADLEAANGYLVRAAAGGNPAYAALLGVELTLPEPETTEEGEEGAEDSE